MKRIKQIGSYTRLLIFVLVAFVLCALLAELYVLNRIKYSFLEEKKKDLITIAKLKSNQIEEWNYERLQDLNFILSNSAYFINLIENAPKSTLSNNQLRKALNGKLQNYNYESVRVIDNQCNVLYGIPENEKELGDFLSQYLPEIIEKNEVFISEIHKSTPLAKPHIDYIVPLKDSTISRETKYFIILSVTPYNVLFPLLKSWQTPSKSTESFIVLSISDSVYYINELRHKNNSSLNLAYSIKDNPELPAAMASKGITGIVEGKDYRNEPVYAAIQPIKNSNWKLIVKIDKSEIHDHLLINQILVYIISFLILLLTLRAIAFIWRKQRIEFNKQQLQGEKERKAIIEHFDYLLKYANDIIILHDKSGLIIEANDKAIEVYGYEYAKLKLMNINSLRIFNDQYSNFDNELLIKNRSLIVETTHITSSKQIIQIEESIRLIEIENNTYYQIIARDITARKQAEVALAQKDKSFQNIFSNMAEGVALHEIVFDENDNPVNYRIVDVNPQYEIITGIIKLDVVGKLATECYGTVEPPYLIEFTRESRKLKNYFFETYFPQMDKHFSISVTPWGNDGDGFATIFTDISERVKSKLEIIELNAQLEKRVIERTAQLDLLNKELEAFSYSISHDLRAPLRAIDGFSTIFIDEYSTKIDAEGNKLIQKIKESAVKMKLLIDDLLSFSRFSRHEIVHQSIDMQNMVFSVIEELKSQGNYQKAQISIDKLPELVSDKVMILQVWRNLISNALKYSAKREVPEISIKSCENEVEIIYQITDNGVGFDMNYAYKLFAVFQRLHSEKEFEGTGVGLAIVFRIITRLNGRIWAESKINEGATFFFSFKK